MKTPKWIPNSAMWSHMSEEQRAALGQQANRDALAFGIDRTEEAYAGLYRELGARGDHS